MRPTKLPKQVFLSTVLVLFSLLGSLGAQTRPIAILGGTLIDGTGRPPITDAAIVIREGRIQEVGKRGEVSLPQGAEVIEAKGKTLLPGLIDGHCHYWEWVGELYLAFGVTTCPDINNSPTEWILAQRDGIQKGKIRGPRLWVSGHALDGPRPSGMPEQRWQRGSVIVRTEEEARKAVRAHVDKGVEGFKFLERLTPEVAKAAADEARRLGRPVIAHSLDIFTAVDAGYTSVEHSWAVMFTTIRDSKKRAEIDMSRMTGKVNTVEAHVYMEPELFDQIVKAMVANHTDSTVSVFTIQGKAVTPAGTVKLGDKSGAAHVAITPDGKTALVTRDADNQISVFAIEGTKLEHTKRDMIAGVRPIALDIAPNGAWAVVGNFGGQVTGDNDTISLIDLKAKPPRIVDTITVGQSPEGVKVSPDG